MFACVCSCCAAAGRRVQQVVSRLADVLFKDTNTDRFVALCFNLLIAVKEIRNFRPAASRADVNGASAGCDEHTRPVRSDKQQNIIVVVVVPWLLGTFSSSMSRNLITKKR